MSSYQQPTFASNHSENPQRTLIVVKVLGFFLLIALLGAGFWRYGLNQSEAKSIQQRTSANLQRTVIAVHSKPGEKSRKLVLPASLRGNAETQLFSRSNGYLSAWHKTIGDQVKKGDLLAEIDIPELEQELAQARAVIGQIKVRLELARSTLKRWTLLKESDSVIQQEYDEKRSAVLQAEADLTTAEVNLKRLEKINDYRHIVAPFSGVITRRSVDVGSLINAGNQELFAITQIDPLRLTVWIPQVYADDVKSGQEVNIRIIEAHNKTVTAHIDHIAGALDPVTRARQVDIALTNNEGKLLPGSYVEVSINVVGNKANPIVVPANTLVIDHAGTHVVIVDAEKHISFRPVKLGRDFGREVEIIEGLTPNDVLVASPSDLLVEGEVVGVVEAKVKEEGKAKAKS